jgi:DNA-binding PadR family transcriptional regulator
MRLKPSAYLVLGMLRLGVGSGYGIKKAADVSTRVFWSTSLAQVYPDLARLEKQGLVTRRDEPRGARPRSVYEVTAKGDEALLGWLRSPREQSPQYRDEGVLRLFFADALGHEDQISLVRRLGERARRAEQEIREDVFPLAEELETSGLRFPAITARLGADLFGFTADWADRLERELAGSAP